MRSSKTLAPSWGHSPCTSHQAATTRDFPLSCELPVSCFHPYHFSVCLAFYLSFTCLYSTWASGLVSPFPLS
eukprot:c32330_g1_i1 orf=1-213(-)